MLDVLGREGRAVPGEISVVGYDDSRLAKFPHVRMTTVSQDAARLAEAAVSGALDLVAGREAAERVFAPHLVERAPPPAGHLTTRRSRRYVALERTE